MGWKRSQLVGLAGVVAVLAIAVAAILLIDQNSPTGRVVGGTCANRCAAGFDALQACQCDANCTQFGDCCKDFKATCQSPAGSCTGRCGTYEAGQACQCDPSCLATGDCCSDMQTACANTPLCGNGAVNAGEECDGAALAGKTCATQGFPAGTISCSAQCTLDVKGCTTPVTATEHNRVVAPDAMTPATMQEFWDGKARFEYVNRFSFPTPDANNPHAWRSMNAGNDIVVRGNTWYLFHREYTDWPPQCQIGARTRIVVRKSMDKGMTWSDPVEIISHNETYNACNSVDGDAYYDEATDTWQYIYQCLGETKRQDAAGNWVSTGTPWNGCHATRKGSDPMGPFVQNPNNPVIRGSAIWTRVAPGQGIFDEGTFEIVEKKGEYYSVTFHGYKPPYGYRGMARTKDFVTYDAPMQTPMLGPQDCNRWTNGQWAPGTCIGVGLASTIYDGGYYYQLIEGADGDLGGANNKYWELAMVRSPTLESSTWEPIPAGGIILSDAPVYNAENADSVGYMRVFRDSDGTIYLIAQRLSSVPNVDADPKTGNYLYKLSKSAPIASYEFREGPGHPYAMSDSVADAGDAFSLIRDAQWTAAGQNNYQLRFNGVNSTIEMPDTKQFKISGPLALQARLRIDQSPAGTSSFIAGKPGSYWFEHYSNGEICFYVQTGSGAIPSCKAMPLQEWVTIEGRYDGQQVVMFLNGIPGEAQSASGLVLSTAPFRVGSAGSTNGYYGTFQGAIEYVKLYDFIPANNAKIIGERFFTAVAPGSNMTVMIRVQNTGTSTWTAGQSIGLGAVGDDPTWSAGRITLAPNDVIGPGQVKTFTFTVKAPQQPGTYPLRFQMLQEGKEWFGEATSNVSVQVTGQVIMPTCTDTCQSGAVECYDGGVRSCVSRDGCNQWTQPIACPAGCSNGACVTPPVCGNGQLESGEECDGVQLNSQTCATKGFASGALGCDAQCRFNTAGCAAAVVPTNPTEMEQFVSHMYRTILGREASAAEASFHAGYMSAPEYSVERMYNVFLTTPEFTSINRTNAQYVAIMYRAVLFRNASQEEIDFQANAITSGIITRESLFRSFLDSEFKAARYPTMAFLQSHPILTPACDLSAYKNTGLDASAALQACIDSFPNGGIAEIAPGKYVLEKQIIFKYPGITLRTKGKTQSMPRCSYEETHDCAEFIASPTMLKAHSFGGIIRTYQPGTVIDHIVLDGNKIARRDSEPGVHCRSRAPDANVYGMNFILHECTNCQVTNSVSKNTLCGTALGATGSGMNLSNNAIVFNGVSSCLGDGMWSDGLTANQAESLTLTGNEFIDNTDIDLILGGCRNCVVSGNTIRHTENTSGYSFAGLMLYKWVGATTGDYTGTTVTGNTIDCGPKKNCAYALYLGGNAWNPYYGSEVFGGTVSSNTARNARQVGLLIYDAHDMTVRDNTVESSARPYVMGTRSYNITKPASPTYEIVAPGSFYEPKIYGAACS